MALSSDKPKTGIVLPTKKSTPSRVLGDYTLLLYGLPKIGKTTFCAEFPKPLFCMFERGAKALEVFQLPDDGRAMTWPQFIGTIKALRLAKNRPFENIIIDTAEEAYAACEAYVCAQHDIEYPGDMPHGKGWKVVRDEFAGRFKEIERMGLGIVFLTHESERTVATREGDEDKFVGPSLGATARKVIEPMVDIWAYYGQEGGKRFIQVVGDDYVLAGNRCQGCFIDWPRIPAGKTSKQAFNNFVSAFRNTLERPKKTDGSGVKLPKSSK